MVEKTHNAHRQIHKQADTANKETNKTMNTSKQASPKF